MLWWEHNPAAVAWLIERFAESWQHSIKNLGLISDHQYRVGVALCTLCESCVRLRNLYVPTPLLRVVVYRTHCNYNVVLPLPDTRNIHILSLLIRYTMQILLYRAVLLQEKGLNMCCITVCKFKCNKGGKPIFTQSISQNTFYRWTFYCIEHLWIHTQLLISTQTTSLLSTLSIQTQ